VGAEEAVEFVALRGGHLLRIGEVRMPETVGDNRGGGVNGTGPAAASDFVDPGDDGRVARAQGALEGPGEGGGFKGHTILLELLFVASYSTIVTSKIATISLLELHFEPLEDHRFSTPDNASRATV